jgi:hypothetical protein
LPPAASRAGLVQASALRVSVIGGPDGITAANRFAVATSPDGRSLLMLPGAAAQALLVGDSRARFEPRHWPALCASLVPAVLAGRGTPGEGAPIRLGLPGPGGPEAASLLALELLGRAATPVYLPAGVTPEAALAARAVDAAVLTGPALAARAASLGVTPWFVFEDGTPGRDPSLVEVPAFGELMSDPPRPDLLMAVRAAGVALRLRGVLVLPALTSADVVALWRGAARRWMEEETDPAEPGARRVGPGEAAAVFAALCPGPETALAYREWLHRRLGWQAG